MTVKPRRRKTRKKAADEAVVISAECKWPKLKMIVPQLTDEQMYEIVGLMANKLRYNALYALRKMMPDENIQNATALLISLWQEMVNAAMAGDFSMFNDSGHNCGTCVGVCGDKREIVGVGLWDMVNERPKTCDAFMSRSSVLEVGNACLTMTKSFPSFATDQKIYVVSLDGGIAQYVYKVRTPSQSTRLLIQKTVKAMTCPEKMLKWVEVMCMDGYRLSLDRHANVKLRVNGIEPVPGEKWSDYFSRAHEEARRVRVEKERSIGSMTEGDALKRLSEALEKHGMGEVLRKNYNSDLNLLIADFFPGRNIWELTAELGG